MTAHTLPLEIPARLPTMYDLPSEDPEEPGLPDDFHYYQPQLLRETFLPAAYPPEQVYVATDLNLYYDPRHVYWHKRPDWFAVVGAAKLYRNADLRLSYVVWDEPRAPFIVVELLSPGTEKEDLGEAPHLPGEPPGKWEVYERILQIPYYVVFSRYTSALQMFRLERGRYRELALDNGRVWLPELQLGLGVWRGKFHGMERLWLRWYGEGGEWIATQEEKLAQAQRSTVQERWRTEQERQRAERLAAKLRELGIDPDELE